MVIPYGKPRSTGLQEGALSVERTLVWVLLITASLAQDPTIHSSAWAWVPSNCCQKVHIVLSWGVVRRKEALLLPWKSPSKACLCMRQIPHSSADREKNFKCCGFPSWSRLTENVLSWEREGGRLGVCLAYTRPGLMSAGMPKKKKFQKLSLARCGGTYPWIQTDRAEI